jgi:hypothetical protein
MLWHWQKKKNTYKYMYIQLESQSNIGGVVLLSLYEADWVERREKWRADLKTAIENRSS